jgi:hypothetical protein
MLLAYPRRMQDTRPNIFQKSGNEKKEKRKILPLAVEKHKKHLWNDINEIRQIPAPKTGALRVLERAYFPDGSPPMRMRRSIAALRAFITLND